MQLQDSKTAVMFSRYAIVSKPTSDARQNSSTRRQEGKHDHSGGDEGIPEMGVCSLCVSGGVLFSLGVVYSSPEKVWGAPMITDIALGVGLGIAGLCAWPSE